MATDISKLTESVKWQDLTTGCSVAGSKTSEAFNTGEWRVDSPEYIKDNCKQ